MAYDDAFRQKMMALGDNVRGKLQASGIAMDFREVKLATVTITGADPDAGDPGTASPPTYTILDPRPKVEMKVQRRMRGGVLVDVGEAKMTVSQLACSREDLLTCAWVEIDGERFKVNEGELQETTMTRLVVLQRLRPAAP